MFDVCMNCKKRNDNCHPTCTSYLAYLLVYMGEKEKIKTASKGDTEYVGYLKTLSK